MVKFVPIDPDEIPNFRESHRGRVSYPILKSFLETGEVLVRLDRQGIQQSLQSLNSSLNAYVKSHNLPIKLFTRQGEIYLARTDTTDAGTVEAASINDFSRNKPLVGIAPKEMIDLENIPVVDDDEVDVRFSQERGQVTK